MPANPPAKSRIYFALGGGTDTLDVLEAVEDLVVVTPIGLLDQRTTPKCWVTNTSSQKVWVNPTRIVRIEPK